MFLRYIRSSLWIFLLSCVMAFCLAGMSLQGFNISAAQLENIPVRVLIIVILNLVLVLISYNRKTIAVGIIAFVAAAVVTVIYLWQAGNLALAFTDTEENRYQFFMICIAIILAVYLLALTRRGIYVLLILGISICAMVHYLYHIDYIAYLILFLISALSMLILRNYQQSIMKAKTVKLAFAGTVLMAVVCCVLVVLISSGIYYGVIGPANPPVRELKLYDKEVAMSIIEQTGVAETVKIPSPALREQMKREQEENTENDTDNSGQQGAGGASGVDKEQEGDVDAEHTQRDDREEEDVLDAIRDPLPKPPIAKILIIAAIIIAGLIIGKRLYRNMWLKKIQAYPKEKQISMIYHFYLKKMKQLKLQKRPEETPYEYLERQNARLAAFHTGTEDAAWLTDVFVRTIYAGEEATEQECEKCRAYYRQLFGRMRNYLGNLRFIFLLYYFRL